jgi:hypothetical protein
MTHASRTASGVDAPSAIAAASYLIALSQLIINVQPLTVGALANAYHLSDRQLGQLSATFIGFATLCTLTGPLWIRRIHWRLFTAIAVVASSVALVSGAWLHSAASFLILFAVLGVVKSGMAIPSFASLGDTSNPDRNYGISVAVQSLSAAGAAAIMATVVIPKFGVPGLFVAMGGAVATGLIASRWLPAAGRASSVAGPSPAGAKVGFRSAIPVILALLGLGFFIGGILGFWYFVERIGASRGIPADVVGLAISLSALGTISTAATVAWLGGRVRSMVFVAGGTITTVTGYALLQVDGGAAFVTTVLLFSLGWGLAQPAYWAISRKVDVSSRLFVAGGAVSGAAGVLVGLAAGPVIEMGGYDLLILLSAGLLVVGAVSASLSILLSNRRAIRLAPGGQRTALG